jgi:hypothetical protein
MSQDDEIRYHDARSWRERLVPERCQECRQLVPAADWEQKMVRREPNRVFYRRVHRGCLGPRVGFGPVNAP